MATLQEWIDRERKAQMTHGASYSSADNKMTTWEDVRRGLARYVPDLVGAPVDIANMALGGLGGKEPVMGSEWLGKKLEGAGVLPPEPETRGGKAVRMIAGLANPGSPLTWGAPLVAALGTFAGVGAKTADVVKLAKAKEMAKAGADPVKVWQETGWTDQFPDGKWRFEIPDNTARSKQVSMGDINLSTPSDVKGAMSHAKLFAAYPDLKSTPFVKYKGNGASLEKRIGSSLTEEDVIRMGDLNYVQNIESAPRSVLLHELQHAVQQREGFARGGSPNGSIPDASVLKEPMDKLNDILLQSGAKIDSLPTSRSVALGGTQAIEVPFLYQTADTAGRIKDAGLLAKYDKYLAELEAAAQKYVDPMTEYRRLAGEAEARLTQSRMNLTPAERAARPPWLEFDVPMEQQIVRGLLGEPTGPAMSVREPTKFQLAHAEAQRNAALPVEQGGLGLGPQNTAMERAKAMGFDTDVYHGTHSRPVGAGNETPDIREFALSQSFGSPVPSVFVSKDTGMANAFAKNYVDNTGAVYPLKLKVEPGKVTETADHARNNEILVHDPRLLRSRFAAFDPKRRNSRDLLASIGLLGLLGAGTYGQEQ